MDLTALFDGFVPSDSTERRHAERCIELTRSVAAPFSRSTFEPGHFTASAFVLAPDRRRVLLIHHRKLERWLQPGGHFEVSDGSVFEAARREVSEETGLTDLTQLRDGLFDVDVHPIPPLGAEPAHEHFDLRVALVSASEALAAGAEVKSARWFGLDEITEHLSDASVVRALEKLRAWARG
jgi:8-oxo-dGTP pyrophosphatase MutT (NUDIX family)